MPKPTADLAVVTRGVLGAAKAHRAAEHERDVAGPRAAADHGQDRQAIFRRKFEIALIVRRAAEDCARAVIHQHEVGDIKRHFPPVEGMDDLQACVELVRGDAAKARAEFEAPRPSIEKIVADCPQDGTRRAQLGLLYGFLGRKEDALREGQRAMELKPITHDVIEGAVVEDFYTLTCARLGDTDKTISRIERLLTAPFAVDYADESITLSDLRQRWEWDPLRNDPRFQKILAGPEPKTLYR